MEKIKKHAPKYDNSKITKEKLFKQVLPNGKFSDRRMNNILSEGYLAAERFVIFQNLSRNQHLQKDLLIKEYQSRELDIWFFKDIGKEINRLESKEIKDWEDHLDLLQFQRSIYNHPNQKLKMQPGDLTILKMGEQLDLAYLLEKAGLITDMIFRNRVIKNENHDVSVAIEKWRTIAKGFQHPAIDFYNMRFAYTEENMLEKYFELRKVFIERFKELNEREQKIHLFSLLNDSAKLSRARRFDLTESLPLYKLGLESEILLHQGKLSPVTFSTIVTASNVKKDFNFTDEIITIYSKKLDESFQKDGLNWAKAHTAYRKKNLSECLDLLLNHDFKIFHFQLLTKSLTTQVYFDLYLENESYQDYLFNYFDSYEKWLRRENFSSTIAKKGFLKFVQKTRALTKSYSNVNFQPSQVENLLKGESNIQGTTWLNQRIQKVLELKKGLH